jgi:hypothetical protein
LNNSTHIANAVKIKTATELEKQWLAAKQAGSYRAGEAAVGMRQHPAAVMKRQVE